MARRQTSSLLYETALPNEYLVEVGDPNAVPILGGRAFKLFKHFMRVPAYVQTLRFTANNANLDFQGIGVEGYASWRINPANPQLAIRTLDFFDERDPMAKTSEELKTICVEAVRHVISKMTVDDVLKKKDEITNSLTNQLKEIEVKWGIVFDQVGIDKVTILSSRLFEDLQSEYRNRLRFDVEKAKINTDSEIATQKNTFREKAELEKYTVDQKLKLIDIENQTKIKEREIEESRNISHKERAVREENYLKELEFNMEKEKKDYDYKVLEQDLKTKLIEVEAQVLEAQQKLEDIQSETAKKKLELQKAQRELEQTFTKEALTSKFIESLPQIYEAMKIQNYSVMGSDASPISKVLQELMFMFKSSDNFIGKIEK